jgi:hypothetical protein
MSTEIKEKCTPCVVLLVESNEPSWSKTLIEIELFLLKMYTTLFLFRSSDLGVLSD